MKTKPDSSSLSVTVSELPSSRSHSAKAKVIYLQWFIYTDRKKRKHMSLINGLLASNLHGVSFKTKIRKKTGDCQITFTFVRCEYTLSIGGGGVRSV